MIVGSEKVIAVRLRGLMHSINNSLGTPPWAAFWMAKLYLDIVSILPKLMHYLSCLSVYGKLEYFAGAERT